MNQVAAVYLQLLFLLLLSYVLIYHLNTENIIKPEKYRACP